MTVTTLSSHRVVPPFGLAGADPGECGKNFVIRANGEISKLHGNDETEVKPGDTFVMETPGGGGFGAK